MHYPHLTKCSQNRQHRLDFSKAPFEFTERDRSSRRDQIFSERQNEKLGPGVGQASIPLYYLMELRNASYAVASEIPGP